MPSSSPNHSAFRYDNPYEEHERDEDYVNADGGSQRSVSGRSSVSRASSRPRPSATTKQAVSSSSGSDLSGSDEDRQLEKELYDLDEPAPRSRWTMRSVSKRASGSQRYHSVAKDEEGRPGAAGTTTTAKPRKWIYITVAVVIILVIIGCIVGFLWHNGTFSKMGSSSAESSSANDTSTGLASGTTATAGTKGLTSLSTASAAIGASTGGASYDNGMYRPSGSQSQASATGTGHDALDWGATAATTAATSANTQVGQSAPTLDWQGSHGSTTGQDSQQGLNWGAPSSDDHHETGVMSIQTVPNSPSAAATASTGAQLGATDGHQQYNNQWQPTQDLGFPRITTAPATTTSNPGVGFGNPSPTENQWDNPMPTYAQQGQQTEWSNPQQNQPWNNGQQQSYGQQPQPSPLPAWDGQQYHQPAQGDQSPDWSHQQQPQPGQPPQYGQGQQQQPQQGGAFVGAGAGAAGAYAWQTFQGPATWYQADQHFGTCGVAVKDTDFVVSVSQQYFASFADRSQICMQQVAVTNVENSVTVNAWIVDSCAYCQGEHSLDLSKTLFEKLNDGNLDKGVINVRWGLSKGQAVSDNVGETSPVGLASMTAGGHQYGQGQGQGQGQARPTATQANSKSTASTASASKGSNEGWQWPWRTRSELALLS